jgi:hypothetical protein
LTTGWNPDAAIVACWWWAYVGWKVARISAFCCSWHGDVLHTVLHCIATTRRKWDVARRTMSGFHWARS